MGLFFFLCPLFLERVTIVFGVGGVVGNSWFDSLSIRMHTKLGVGEKEGERGGWEMWGRHMGP